MRYSTEFVKELTRYQNMAKADLEATIAERNSVLEQERGLRRLLCELEKELHKIQSK